MLNQYSNTCDLKLTLSQSGQQILADDVQNLVEEAQSGI